MHAARDRCALYKEIVMRFCLALLCFGFPAIVLADSIHTIEVINDTGSRIDTFSMAPAGTTDWTVMDFRKPMQESYFDYELAVIMEFRDHDGCRRDLRTELSDGRRILARNFDLCHFHAYRPGTRFRNGQGSQIVP
jgi:hypothetical protein